MTQKLVRDPLYNYISLDGGDAWLVELLDCPEVQRLRRIHQLGVSELTYPGASHTRFAHTLGVMHLMRQVLDRAERIPSSPTAVPRKRAELLAAAVLHDVGHGPFSHLAETFLRGDHEVWSARIILDPEGSIRDVLERNDVDPTMVARLIHDDGQGVRQWQKSMLSSQLDVDRMDYLRRDSLASGGGYGSFDWFRLVNTFEFDDLGKGDYGLVWPEKAKLAIEEFIFARLYMYENVYFHKTTRGFEKILDAMWTRASELAQEKNSRIFRVASLRAFDRAGERATPQQYLAVEEHSILGQIDHWREHADPVLSDLARRFTHRQRLRCLVEPPAGGGVLTDDEAIHLHRREELQQLVVKRCPGSIVPHCLLDQVKSTYNQPYLPESEGKEKGPANLIRVMVDGEAVEVSLVLDRLKPVVKPRPAARRHYVPAEVYGEAKKLVNSWGEPVS